MGRTNILQACCVTVVSILALVAIPTRSARAETYGYICKDQGRPFPLKLDDTSKTLEWRGTMYRIKETEDCAKFGWRVEKDGASFDFCTATQGYANCQRDGTTVQCNLKRR
jgi:hypothetical protein